MAEESIQQLINLPKCELHLHLEGIVSSRTLWCLQQRHGLCLPGINSEADLKQRLHTASLDEFIDCFINIVQVSFRSEDDIYLLIQDLELYLQRNNIVYAEVFFAPSKLLQSGLSYAALADVLQQGAIDIENRQQRTVRFLIDVSRSFGVDNAMVNLRNMLVHPRPAIIGIGLGGSERSGAAADFVKVFQEAAAQGLHRVAHAGEDLGAASIRAAVELLQAERIGHATSLVEDPELLEQLAAQQLPIEACPSSNVFTGRYIQQLSDHPIRLFVDRGLLVTLNSDDPTFFAAELNDEYLNLHRYCNFNTNELLQLLRNSVSSSFAEPRLKEQLLRDLPHSRTTNRFTDSS